MPRRALSLLASVLLSCLGACSDGAPVTGGTGGATATSTSSGTTTGSSGTGGSGDGDPTPWCNRGPSVQICDPFGVMIEGMDPTAPAYWDLVTGVFQLSFYRPAPLFLDQFPQNPAACTSCEAGVNHGLYLLLVVRNDGGPLTPTSPPADLDSYAATLGMALDHYRDALAVVMIEDEVGPASTSYAGSTAEYLAELKVGCEAAHARKLRCSNAALPSTSLLYVLADYYRGVGFEQESRRILQAAKSNPGVPQMFKDGQATTSDIAAFLLGHQAEIDSGKQLLAGLRDAGVDYVNLHSYEEDLDTFDESVALMRSATACNKVIVDELGQRVQDGADASHRLADAKELGLPFVVWSSPGTSGTAPLVDDQGNLLPSGAALETASTTATCSD